MRQRAGERYAILVSALTSLNACGSQTDEGTRSGRHLNPTMTMAGAAGSSAGDDDLSADSPSSRDDCTFDSSATADITCDATRLCPSEQHSISCITFDAQSSCGCDGVTFTFSGDALGDEACRRGLDYCPIPADYFECPYEPRLLQDSCMAGGSCTYGGLEAGDSFDARWFYESNCSREGDHWVCFCRGVGTPNQFIYKLVRSPNEEIDSACAAAADICTQRTYPLASTLTECFIYDVEASEVACRLSSVCYFEEVEVGGRVIAAGTKKAVLCELGEMGWTCRRDTTLATSDTFGATLFTRRSELPDQASPCVDYFVQDGGLVD